MIVYTGGTFDLIHPGHVHLLSECRRLAGADGTVWVALNRDAFIQRYKQREPIMRFDDRKTVLESIRYVDHVIPNFDDEDSRTAIELVKPNVIVVGEDWKTRDYHAQMGFDAAWLEARQITIEYVAHVPGRSSTTLRATAASQVR